MYLIFRLFAAAIMAFGACSVDHHLHADPLPFDPVNLPKFEPALKLQSDYELTRTLVEQTQAQLGDFELLSDEYERFQELDERLHAQPDSRELAGAMISCAKRIHDVLDRRHLRSFFSPEFVKQIDIFAGPPRDQR